MNPVRRAVTVLYWANAVWIGWYLGVLVVVAIAVSLVLNHYGASEAVIALGDALGIGTVWAGISRHVPFLVGAAGVAMSYSLLPRLVVNGITRRAAATASTLAIAGLALTVGVAGSLGVVAEGWLWALVDGGPESVAPWAHGSSLAVAAAGFGLSGLLIGLMFYNLYWFLAVVLVPVAVVPGLAVGVVGLETGVPFLGPLDWLPESWWGLSGAVVAAIAALIGLVVHRGVATITAIHPRQG